MIRHAELLLLRLRQADASQVDGLLGGYDKSVLALADLVLAPASIRILVLVEVGGYPLHHPGRHRAREGTLDQVSGQATNAGFSEGWGLYAEQLTNEMGVYSSDLAQLGRLSNAALRAARLVIRD